MKNIFSFLQLAALIEDAKTDSKTLEALIFLDPVIKEIPFALHEYQFLERKKSELLLIYANK